MSAPQRILFLDRDGTLIEEPPDNQVDSLAKVRFLPDVFAGLNALRRRGFIFVMVTNQDGLGTQRYPQAAFDQVQRFVIETFASQGIVFEAVLVCPHMPGDGCRCRKPQTTLAVDFLSNRTVDLAASGMVGDRETDREFAQNLGVRSFRVSQAGPAHETWPAIAQALIERRANCERTTKETSIAVTVNLDATAPLRVATGIGFFDHMLEQLAKHGGFALELVCTGDLQVDEHHTIEDCALALGDALRRAVGAKAGIARYGFVLPMDEAQAQVALDLSGRAYFVFTGQFNREAVGGLATELVPHFFRSLSDSLGAALHISVTGSNTHHMIEACFKGVGRALRQAFRRDGEEVPSTKGVL